MKDPRPILRRRRAALGWTIAATSRAAGLTRANVSDYLAGKTELTTASLAKLTKALGVRITFERNP